MKIESYLLLKEDGYKDFSEYKLEDGTKIIQDFNIDFECMYANNKNIIKLNFITLKPATVNAICKLDISFHADEKFVKHVNYFPHFSHKTFTPIFFYFYTNKKQIVIKCARSFPFYFSKCPYQKKISIKFLIDAPCMHPAWDYQLKQRRSTANPLQPEGTMYHFETEIFEFENTKSILPIQQYTYPFASKAAFILTDHCDFDTTEKLKVFLYGNDKNGWLGRSLKISKGVFTLAPKDGEPKKNASLEEEEYFKLINILHEDGSEILPHALKSRGQLNSKEFYDAIQKISNLFHPKTWIDHGSYLKYCYSQDAANNPDYLLTQTLKKYHYNNLWSFHDVNIDASQTLNICTDKQFLPGKLILVSLKHFFTGKWLVAAHYLRSIIHRNYSKNIVSDYLMFAMANTKQMFINFKNKKLQLKKEIPAYLKSLGKFNSIRNEHPVPYKNRDVLKYSAALYTEDRRPISQHSGNDLLMFYTFEATHIIDIYSKKALQKLIKEYGTHIGHTYILNDLPYINTIFTKRNSQYNLKDKWINFLETLSDYVRKKVIWNPTMAEFSEYSVSLQNIRLDYLSEIKIMLSNNNNFLVEGYTLITPKHLKPELKVNKDIIKASSSDLKYHFFIFDLKALETKYITI